ncbi:MAG: DUF6473 family protein [Cyanobacteriota bacterium]|nr:DUF6473 family protein [Cyanobacteriota bacterium]
MKSPSYPERDKEIIDYQTYFLENTGQFFRGPKIENLSSTPHFVCIGAAQTFGCFCERPYPKILEEKLNLPPLNLGVGGAGPSFYLKNEALISYINQGQFAIVQVMSGRSEGNHLFESRKGTSFLTKVSDGTSLNAEATYSQLLKAESRSVVRQIVAETRQNWLNNYKKLLGEIKIPKILLWFSVRKPYYQERYANSYQLFGDFPQFVNLKMMEQLRQYSDDYVECVSIRGKFHLLASRFTGKPVYVPYGPKKIYYNTYYPSPEMHVDAAYLLEEVCKKYLT